MSSIPQIREKHLETQTPRVLFDMVTDLTKMAAANKLRLQHLKPSDSWGQGQVIDIINNLDHMKTQLTTHAKERFGDTRLGAWCDNVKGLGNTAELFFNSFDVKKYKLGQIYAYLGLTPESKMKRGEQAHFNPSLKGKIYMFATSCIMHKDPYYYKLYIAKKKYVERRRKVEKKTEKGWKAHNNNLAKRWLMKLLLSHAYELMRREKGLEVYEHHPHIPPKPESLDKAKKVLKKVVPVIGVGKTNSKR